MEQEKWLEEMVKALEELAECGWIDDIEVEELAQKLLALKIYKIPEGSVVLTKEELAKHDEKVRKKTATNFFKDLIRQANFYGETDMWFNYKTLVTVAKQNGVEVEE